MTLQYNKRPTISGLTGATARNVNFLQLHAFHPIFYMSAGNSETPLQVQASIRLCATSATHLALDTAKNHVETIYTNLEVASSRYAEVRDKEI